MIGGRSRIVVSGRMMRANVAIEPSTKVLFPKAHIG